MHFQAVHVDRFSLADQRGKNPRKDLFETFRLYKHLLNSNIYLFRGNTGRKPQSDVQGLITKNMVAMLILFIVAVPEKVKLLTSRTSGLDLLKRYKY